VLLPEIAVREPTLLCSPNGALSSFSAERIGPPWTLRMLSNRSLLRKSSLLLRVSIGDVRIYFDVVGMALVPDVPRMRERPVLLVLHGGPAFDHTVNKNLLAPLQDVAQVVFIDHRAVADDDFVLATRTGGQLSQRKLARALAEAATSAGLGYVTPQTLRRSVASLAARRGVDPVQAARMTGHSLDVWTRRYAGDDGKLQRDEARSRMLEHGSITPSRDAY
jgi:hypothetical protein